MGGKEGRRGRGKTQRNHPKASPAPHPRGGRGSLRDWRRCLLRRRLQGAMATSPRAPHSLPRATATPTRPRSRSGSHLPDPRPLGRSPLPAAPPPPLLRAAPGDAPGAGGRRGGSEGSPCQPPAWGGGVPQVPEGGLQCRPARNRSERRRKKLLNRGRCPQLDPEMLSPRRAGAPPKSGQGGGGRRCRGRDGPRLVSLLSRVFQGRE